MDSKLQSSEQPQENYLKIKTLATAFGCHLFGVADVSKIKREFIFPVELTQDLNYAISLGFHLQHQVLQEIEDHPTYLYFHHYRQINNLLDQAALKIASILQADGFKALPIPASQVIDWQQQKGHLSHKKIAVLAGLGWIGCNNLLVNRQYGAHVRLVTILTDLPLSCDQGLKENCGSCRACVSVCPAQAIKSEQKDFDHQACFAKLKEFQKKGYTPQYVCGICVKVCNGKAIK